MFMIIFSILYGAIYAAKCYFNSMVCIYRQSLESDYNWLHIQVSYYIHYLIQTYLIS